MPTVSELVSKQIGNTITNSQTWGGIITNVKAYGAKGDGVTDDTAAFNLATLAAEMHTGGNATTLKRTILVPPGDYLIAGTVYVRKGQHLKGSGLGSTRIVVPVISRTDPTFLMGSTVIDGVTYPDSGGLPPTISDLCTEGGSTASAIFDCGNIAGVSLNNLFITTASLGIKAGAGDLQAYNLTIDNGSVGIEFPDGSSRNVIMGCSFFFNNFGIIFTGSTYDVIISNSNFDFSQFADIEFNPPADGNGIKGISIRDCNFTMNEQYTTNLGGIVFNNVQNADVSISDCVFHNLYNYAINHANAAIGNNVVVKDCIFDGLKTHHSYIQGTTSKGILVGNNNFVVSDCIFRNLKGGYCIGVDGTTGSLKVDGCRWKDNTANYFIEFTAAGTTVEAVGNVGDDVLPLINVFAGANAYLSKNSKWLGAVLTGSSKNYVKVPTYSQFNGMVRVIGNPNAVGSANYRKTGLFSVFRQTEFIASALQDNVVSVTLSQAAAGFNIALGITVGFDTITGADTLPFVANRYIIISVPDTWSTLEFVVE